MADRMAHHSVALKAVESVDGSALQTEWTRVALTAAAWAALTDPQKAEHWVVWKAASWAPLSVVVMVLALAA